ncbi:MAG TPA: OmpA family protein [Candidatus Acidoferrales bacterium]|nr:OmpA family protein [Candidatus Acidoferrales bacterium]
MGSIFVRALFLCLVAILPIFAQQSSPSSTESQSSTQQSTAAPDQSSPDSRQQPGTSQQPDTSTQTQTPTYRVTVVERTTQAVNYRDRGGTTQVDMRGTSLAPQITGDAKVTGHTGRLAIDNSLHHLPPANAFGPEYLTYVLWAITAEGRPVNLGEIIRNGDGNSRVQVTTGLQEFGLIVTAEPYFAVSRPSDLVVAENIVRNETLGGVHPISAKFDLIRKGQYTLNVTPDQLPATNADPHVPLQLLEAENAIAIAEADGADQYASDTIQKAKAFLAQGQDYYRRKQGITPIGAVARAATQSAEDARLLTLEKKQQEQAAAERQRARDRIAQAQSQAEQEAARAQEARDQAQREAEQRATAEQERQAAEQARLQAEQAAQQAAQDRAAAQQQLAQAEQARQNAIQQQQALAQQAEQARLQAQQADQARLQSEQQAAQQRQRLLTQLNQVLQTRDSARGLIVSMSDVLFDLNKATLRNGAQLRLAKVAGIILAYPDLKLEIDGFTDNTGTPQYNQTLSDKRAESVKKFLVSQGVAPDAVSTRGYGESNPVASNATASGRQMNRRVELVVSGAAIGGSAAPGAPGAQQPVGSAAPSIGSSQGNGSAQGTGSAQGNGSAQGTGPAQGTGSAQGTQGSAPVPAAPAASTTTAPAASTTTATPAQTGSQPSNVPASSNPAPAPPQNQQPANQQPGQSPPATPNPTPPPE